MAESTPSALRQKTIYSIFVRNHTKEGTFRAAQADLGRIRALGTDYIWLMPIHPVGKVARKGALGSPYAISDYRAINPEYGTLEDFAVFADAVHALGMKLMIDVVYNHTSPDSVLWQTHPEWFYRKPDGTPGNHVGDWSDIIDLDYTHTELWDYQIETLCQWAHYVDGFRCDVAPFVPVEFWKRAREEVAKVRPDCIWLAETVHASFGDLMRSKGLNCATDDEDFEAFDIEYEYDIRELFEDVLKGKKPLSAWAEALNGQETRYPANYDKLRFLENHDTERIASFVHDPKALAVFTALVFYLKGTTLIYGGQEIGSTLRPSLFDKDTVLWDWRRAELDGRDLSDLMARMSKIAHEVLGGDDTFQAAADDKQGIMVCRRDGLHPTLGIFPLRGRDAEAAVDLPDGTYRNLVTGQPVTISDGTVSLPGCACIIER